MSSGEEARTKHDWQFPIFRVAARSRAIPLFLLLGSYFLVGGLVYTLLEEHEDGSPWTVVDSLYFTTMTVSTVGYGDLSPGSDGTRAFTMLMIFYGIIVIFPRIASAIGIVTDPITARGRALLEYCFPQMTVDIDGDGSADYKIPCHPVIHYAKNMLPSILLTLMVQIVSALVFTRLEDWTFYTACYHCIVTATTVGYGDVAIVTQGGRLWASVNMFLSVCLLGEEISTLDSLRSERREQLERIWQLQRRLDDGLLDQLRVRAEELCPVGERHDLGLTELEFAMVMVIELGMVTTEQVLPFIKQFRLLDADNSGRLCVEDLQLSRATSQEEIARIRSAVRSTSGALVRPSSRSSLVRVVPQDSP